MSLSGILATIEGRKEGERSLLRRALAGEAVTAPFLPPPAQIALAARVLREGGEPTGRSLEAACAGDRLGVVAEIKRRSPSAGLFASWEDPEPLARAYADGGADAMSVLTDVDFFGGRLDFLPRCRAEFGGPVLRKDFMNSPEELALARVCGADAVLLICPVVGPRLAMLLGECARLGLEALVEVRTEAELDDALAAGARILGVNNRDLRSFEVDLATTERLASRCPDEVTLVAESGIKTAVDARRMRDAGADAVLVGESLARAGGAGVSALQVAGARGRRA